MKDRIVFPSLACQSDVDREQLAYTLNLSFDTLYSYPNRGRPIGDHFGFFMTYGDGLVQHSNESAVQFDAIEDYTASLAEYLLTPCSTDDMELVAHKWPHNHDRKDIEFAMKVKWRDDKVQYYSTQDRKISTSESKRHDKRWEAVPEWADGSLPAVVRICATEYANSLERYYLANKVADEFHRNDQWAPRFSQYECAGFTKDYKGHFDQAFDAVTGMVEAYYLSESARRSLGCWHNNMKQREVSAA